MPARQQSVIATTRSRPGAWRGARPRRQLRPWRWRGSGSSSSCSCSCCRRCSRRSRGRSSGGRWRGCGSWRRTAARHDRRRCWFGTGWIWADADVIDVLLMLTSIRIKVEGSRIRHVAAGQIGNDRDVIPYLILVRPAFLRIKGVAHLSASENRSTLHQKPAVGEACQLPLQNCF